MTSHDIITCLGLGAQRDISQRQTRALSIYAIADRLRASQRIHLDLSGSLGSRG